MISTKASTGKRQDSLTTRLELACALRWAARLGMHEGTANHFSAAVSADGSQFLINPAGYHFAEIRASDLLLVDGSADRQPAGVDPTAWAIHGAIHRNNPQIRCALHVHSPYATALSCLQDPALPPIDQNTMRFFERVAVDTEFNGMGFDDEAERLSRVAHIDKPILLLCQHGVVAFGESVAAAFDYLYYFERSCQTWLNVLATGRPYRLASTAIARKTASQWETYPDFARQHFAARMRMLDRDEPDYRK